MKRSTQYIVIGAVAFLVLLGALMVVSNNQQSIQLTATAEVATLSTPTPDVVFRAGDGDGDGVLDEVDACPAEGVAGQVDATGCPLPVEQPQTVVDSDGDGVEDAVDTCPNEAGDAGNGGCPVQAPPPPDPNQQVATDSDGDGVPDANDTCPNEAGDVGNGGCPQQLPPPPDPNQQVATDSDGDGVADATDSCPNEAGDASNGGCPVQAPPPPADSDGDTVDDSIDRCPNTAPGRMVYGGDSSVTGCDLPDTDGDGVQDVNDQCPYESGDAGNNGCPAQQLPQAATEEPQAATEEPAATQEAQAATEEPQAAANVADWSATTNGLSVSFDASSNPTATSYSWNFGADATPATSTSEDASVTYAAAGDYSVTLTVTFPDGSTLPLTKTVTVSAPTETASCQVTGAAQDTSTPSTYLVNFAASGTGITSYTWDFGNGTSGTGANAQATYSGPGTFTYTLTCATSGQSIVLNGSVTITEIAAGGVIINAGFSANRASGPANFELVLTNTTTVSPAGTALTYSWSVTGPGGYSQSSTAASPRFTLAGVGRYNISMTASDGTNSASATGSVEVVDNVNKPIVTINADVRSGVSPLTVNFSAVSTGGPIDTYTWDFGNGTTGNGANGTATYTEAGTTYTITLNVSGAGGTAAATTTVVVLNEYEEAIATFTSTQTRTVEGQIEFCFENTTVGTYDSATWNFGDGTSQATMDKQICHLYNGGTYVVELAITKPGGVLSTSQQQITPVVGLTPPTVTITASKTTVNVGETVNFTASTTGAIRTYEWNFGEFGTSGDVAPSITFNKAGTFVVNLRVTGPGGTAEAAAVNIEVGFRAIACTMDGATTAKLGDTKTYKLNLTNIAGRTVTYRWTVNGAEASTTDSVSVSFPSAGTTTVVGEAFVDGASVCNISRSVSLTLATLDCKLNGTTSPLLGQTPIYSLNVSNANLNGRTITGYAWTLTAADGSQVSSGTSKDFSYTFGEGGASYTLTLNATANNGDVCSVSTNITTRSEAIACSIDGNTRYEVFQARTYTANVSGSSGTITYKWFVNGVEQAGQTAKTFRYVFPDNSATSINVEITRGGNTCNPSIGLTPGTAGTAITCTVANIGTVQPGQRANLSVTVNNLRGRTATYSWTVDGDAAFSASTQSVGYSSLTSGSYTARYRVTTTPGNDVCEGSVSWTVSSEVAKCTARFAETINPYSTSSASVQVTSFAVQNPTINWTINGAAAGTGSSITYPADLVNVPNSSFTVAYTVSGGGATLCEGNFTVRTSGDQLACSIQAPAQVFVGEAATFNVSVNNANGRAMSYEWFVNGQSQGAGAGSSLTTTYSGDAATPLTVRVVGTPSTGAPCDVSVNVSANASQNISASANPNTGTVNTLVNFSATTTGIDRSTLTWKYPDGSTERAENGSFIFDTVGEYTVEVTGVGLIRTQTASVVVRIVDKTQLVAAFRADPWEAVAPFRICFTDLSTSGLPITSWSWDFGNGTTSTEQNPCVNFDTAGDYNVTLNVGNGVLQGRASNRVRLYTLTDANISIGVDVRGSGEVCFTANKAGDITVTGWNFGDGQTGAGQDQICHTYSENKDYTVSLTFAKGNLTGSINTSVRVDGAVSTALPVLRVTGSCSSSNVASFRISNVGGAMGSDGIVSVTGTASGNLGTQSFRLGNLATYDFSVNGQAGETITVIGDGLSASTSVKCAEAKPPKISIVGECFYGEGLGVKFTVTNEGTTTYLGTATVTRPSGGNLDEVLEIAAGGNQEIVTFTGAGDYGISVPSGESAVTNNQTCVEPETPDQLTGSRVCWESNTSYRFTVSNPGTETVTFNVDGTEYSVEGGKSVNVSVNGTYPTATLNASYDDQTLTLESSDEYCGGVSPKLSASGICTDEGQVTFTVSNEGVVDLTEGSLVVESFANADELEALEVLEETSFNLNAGDTQTFVYERQEGRFVELTYGTEGDEVEVSVACAKPVSITPPPGSTPPGGTPAATPVPSGTPETPEGTETPVGGKLCGEITIGTNGFPLVDMDQEYCSGGTETALSNWQPLSFGEGFCPTWIVYHTNTTGDWEIFRLGDLPADRGFNVDADINISKGYGANISDLGPTRSPDAKWLAFASNRDGDLEIFITPVDGTLEDQIQLTINDGAVDFDPVWSPDGRFIAYETTVYGTSNFEIGLIDLSNGAKIRLTDNVAPDFNPVWSPDSRHLLFQSNRDGGDWALYEMDITDLEDIQTKRISPEMAGVDFQDASYAPDGKSYVTRLESTVDGVPQSLIAIFDLETGEMTQVTDSGTALNVSFSSDGKYLAYQSNSADNTSDIYAYEVETGAVRLVTSNEDRGQLSASPTWLCDTSTIVFSSDADGDNDLYSLEMLPMDADPVDILTGATNLTNNEDNDRSPQNTPSEENSSRNGATPKKATQG
jgi:PKD repeat protein/Tol biopolymer transport system component